MHKDELRLRERAYRNGWLRERKLHLIWRAIACRHLSRSHAVENQLNLLNSAVGYHDLDGETDLSSLRQSESV
jgi:hypothetical protein